MLGLLFYSNSHAAKYKNITFYFAQNKPAICLLPSLKFLIHQNFNEFYLSVVRKLSFSLIIIRNITRSHTNKQQL